MVVRRFYTIWMHVATLITSIAHSSFKIATNCSLRHYFDIAALVVLFRGPAICPLVDELYRFGAATDIARRNENEQ